MIDFKYHVVSIVAVFLALAVGLVLGTTTLNGFVLDDLKGRVNGLRMDKAGLEDQLRAQQDAARNQEQALAAVAPAAVADRLAGRSVVLLIAPGSEPGLVSAVAADLDLAGADVTGRVSLGGELFADGSSAVITSVLERTDTTGVTIPTDADPLTALSTVLSAALVAPADKPAALEPLRRTQLLSELRETGLVTSATPTALDLASLAVVVSPPSASAEAAVRGTAQLAGALDGAGDGAVLATSKLGTAATASKDAVLALRGSSSLSEKVSTVDDVTSGAGTISIVFGLMEQTHGGVGQYGQADSATALVPPDLPRVAALVPTPSPSATDEVGLPVPSGSATPAALRLPVLSLVPSRGH